MEKSWSLGLLSKSSQRSKWNKHNKQWQAYKKDLVDISIGGQAD